MSDAPCATCPWRKTSTVGGFDIPKFDLDKMRNLACCFPKPGRDGFHQVMACHYSEDGAEIPCKGYVANVGWDNINLRLLAAWGRVDIAAAIEACSSLDLWDSFDEMLAAYEAANGEGDYSPESEQLHAEDDGSQSSPLRQDQGSCVPQPDDRAPLRAR